VPRGPYRHSRLILCEGEEDVYLLSRIAEVVGGNAKRFHVETTAKEPKKAAGKGKFKERLKALKSATGFERIHHILLVTDNDDNHDESFKAICDQVRLAGFIPPAAALVRSGGHPSITIAMLPTTGEPGALESTLSDVARENNPRVAAEVDMVMALLHSEGWPPLRRSKAWLRVFLAIACSRDPCILIGEALANSRGDDLLPINSTALQVLRGAVAQIP
jgi:hypothetical protein